MTNPPLPTEPALKYIQEPVHIHDFVTYAIVDFGLSRPIHLSMLLGIQRPALDAFANHYIQMSQKTSTGDYRYYLANYQPTGLTAPTPYMTGWAFKILAAGPHYTSLSLAMVVKGWHYYLVEMAARKFTQLTQARHQQRVVSSLDGAVKTFRVDDIKHKAKS